MWATENQQDTTQDSKGISMVKVTHGNTSIKYKIDLRTNSLEDLTGCKALAVKAMSLEWAIF